MHGQAVDTHSCQIGTRCRSRHCSKTGRTRTATAPRWPGTAPIPCAPLGAPAPKPCDVSVHLTGEHARMCGGTHSCLQPLSPQSAATAAACMLSAQARSSTAWGTCRSDRPQQQIYEQVEPHIVLDGVVRWLPSRDGLGCVAAEHLEASMALTCTASLAHERIWTALHHLASQDVPRPPALAASACVW